MKKIAVIGSGFAGISAATCLAREGFDVTVYEKNATPGGRARQLSESGFTFDMGPSWYWMPDVFERYFARFGKKSSNYYSLKRLDPSYRIYFGPNDFMDIPATMDKLDALFEKLEPGSSRRLRTFLDEGKFKYEIGMNSLVYKPGLSLLEFANTEVISGALRLHLFQSISRYLRKFFKNERILKLLEFPVLFLGATADKTPALYSLMNYADISLGTWYPKGGMYAIVTGMEKLAMEQGVKFCFNSSVEEIPVKNGKAMGVVIHGALIPSDYVIAGADYHHVEQQLVPEKYRRYSPAYWDSRVMAPSSLLFYIGINKRVEGLLHHTLFFDEDFTKHSREIYEEPQWPTAPQFYVSCSSLTDAVAPEGFENLVILVPVAPGLADTEETREKYYKIIMKRLETITGQSLIENVVYKRSYAHNDFQADYNAFKGNAYGLANTLLQTAILKPSIINKKIGNLLYTGQLTVPGPGVPPSLISGQVVADQILEWENKERKS